PEVLEARVAAIRPAGRLVRAHLREVDVDVADPIAPCRHLRPDDATDRLVAWKGTAVVERLHPVGEDRAVILHSDLDIAEPALVSVGVGHVVVGPPLGPVDRSIELPSEQTAD